MEQAEIAKAQEVDILPEGRTVEESIAISILPYPYDDKRARYLGLRASGFTVREACRFMGIHNSNVSLWRDDPKFKQIEDDLPEYRDKLSRDYLNLEFTRNFRYVLKKDYEVLKKSVDDPENLSKFDKDYLIKLRTQYTPQQFQILEALAGNQAAAGGEFNFTKLVTEIQREQVRVTMERDNGS